MLSYRHSFHAGNHADVLKHFILYLVLTYFNQKDKAYWYIDTHSGAGVYDLQSKESQKIAEFRDGIARLQNATMQSASLSAFLAHLKHSLPEQYYFGSPGLAQSLLRPIDKMRFFELHPSDFDFLNHNLKEWRLSNRAIAKQENGFSGLIALLPPITRRAVILMDPPYEQKQDYDSVVRTLKAALKRFATGCYLVWYPILSRKESQTLPEQLKKLSPERYLRAELWVKSPRSDGLGMHGSGMFILNPPYALQHTLHETLPELSALLAQDSSAHFVLDAHIQ